MTDADLIAAFKAHTDGQSNFTRRMVIAISLMAGERPRTIVKRCEQLELCRDGSWDWFVQNGSITPAHFDEFHAARKAIP